MTVEELVSMGFKELEPVHKMKRAWQWYGRVSVIEEELETLSMDDILKRIHDTGAFYYKHFGNEAYLDKTIFT